MDIDTRTHTYAYTRTQHTHTQIVGPTERIVKIVEDLIHDPMGSSDDSEKSQVPCYRM